jgi:hypothetical protein
MGDISRALAAVVLSNDAASSHESTRRMTNVGGGTANGRARSNGRGPGGGVVYVFGGSDGESDLGCGEVVGEEVMSVGAAGRDKGGGWSGVECCMSSKRRSAGCAVVGGRLFVIGGWGGSGALASCEMYDGAEGTWRDIASMHTKRQAMGVAALHGRETHCLLVITTRASLLSRHVPPCYHDTCLLVSVMFTHCRHVQRYQFAIGDTGGR